MKSSSHQWAAAFGISLLVLVSLVVIIASRSSIGDIRNRASGQNCQEDTVKHTCGNPRCVWDPNVGPYGSCVLFALNTPTPTPTPYPFGYHKDEASCKASGGCWVKSHVASSCIENGTDNSGYRCSNGVLAPIGGSQQSDTYTASPSECRRQGGCVVGNSTCVKPGGIYIETGDTSNPRTLRCVQGGGWDIIPTPTRVPVAVPSTSTAPTVNICDYLRLIGHGDLCRQ